MTSILFQQNRKTRRGWLGKKVKEVYLRDDIPCGFQACPEHSRYFNVNNKSPAFNKMQEQSESQQQQIGNLTQPFAYDQLSQETIYFIDHETLENQIDIIYNCQQMNNLIILQSQVQRLRSMNLQKYNAFKNFIEGANRKVLIFADLYHKQIRDKNKLKNAQILIKSIKWFQSHVKDFNMKINFSVIASGFNEAYQKQNNLKILSLIDFLKQKNSSMLDFLGFQDNLKAPIFAEKIFQTHLETSEADQKVKKGVLFQGKFMRQKSYIKVARKMYPIQLENNRAIFGDVVAVELYPSDQWKKKFIKSLQDDDQYDQNQTLGMSGQTLSKVSKDLINLLENGNLQPKGKVVSVLKRKTNKFCGTINEEALFENIKQQYGIYEFYPVDTKFPRFFIRSFNVKTLINKRIIAAFDSWPQNSQNPLCHFMKMIGQVGNQRAQGDVILLQHNVQIAQFSKMAYACLPQAGDYFKIPPEQQQKRLDLRGINVVSIDPPGCKDIDDALHCIVLENGNFEVGVHIADVSYYVRPDTALDLQARNRSTTVYLVNRRTDMLPKLLTENLCSLRSDVERLAFSTIWEMDSQGNILNTKFTKTIIKSRKAFTYMQAQDLIDSQSQSDIAKGIRGLNVLAKKLKQKRLNKGALQLASTQVKITLSEETHSATDVQLYNLVQTNSLIEEFMLLSNCSVAEKIYERFPALSILRRHTQPKATELQTLRQIMSQQNFEFNFDTSKDLADSLNRIQRKNDPFFNKLIRILTTRCMNQATYFCSADFDPQQFFHYGLAAPFYTHFTSPIRRYADVLVHRLLAAAIDLQPLPNFMINKLKMTKICQNMNMRHRMARYASRASSDYYTYQFFKDRQGAQEKGIIVSISEEKVGIMLIKYGLQSSILLCEEERKKTVQANLKGNNTTVMNSCFLANQQYRLFDYVNVEVKVQLKGFHKIMNIKIL